MLQKKFFILDKSQESDHFYNAVDVSSGSKNSLVIKMSTPSFNVSKDIGILNKIKWTFVPAIVSVGVFNHDKPQLDD